jgi:Zn-dependent protease
MGLALFNMLPIPPLDGSHLVTTWLTRVNMPLAVTYFRYGSLALLALIVIERLTRMDILPIGRLTMAIVTWFYRLLGIM